MDAVTKELLVPTKYIKVIDGRICLTIHRNWLTNLVNIGPISFIYHERLSEDEIAAHPTLEDLGPDWIRIYVKVCYFLLIQIYINTYFCIIICVILLTL